MKSLNVTKRAFCLTPALVALLSVAVLADPCGMVPPVYVGPGTPIARTGDQNTFVFYKDGVETFVIHPGFKGQVEEFGMLIPFPKVPELRKVSDNIFPHLRAAIDPPEVVVYAFNRRFRGGFGGGGPVANAAKSNNGLEMAKDPNAVRVVKEEAVGMYEVAVLDAGSAKALKKWMDDHGYKYPKGMDKACEDYVKQRWCFVAVKTRVSGKKGVDPKPGQREVKTGLPKGASFDGHVQAMGFRFKTDRLVVPMRLSTFNEGDLHNIVYVLADKPQKIRSIPEEYVVRQISGGELYKNVTQPLPLRVIGGTVKNIQAWQKKNLPQRRDPVPHNGAARDLFAADLLAVSSGQLSHPHEEKEKMLLRIGEALNLRGPAIDKLNEGALAEQREKIVAKSLKDIKGMTLSVIDGNFPREVLANQNLAFATYQMPARRNTSRFYDAKTKKATTANPQGTLIQGALSFDDSRTDDAEKQASNDTRSTVGFGVIFFAVAIGSVLVLRNRKGARIVAILIAVVGLSTATASTAFAQPKKKKPTNLELIDQLKDPKKADAAAKALIARGKGVIPDLIGEAVEGNDLAMRGWAIVCLAEIGGKEASDRLIEMQDDKKQPMLVRTWAAAGRVKMATTTKELLQLANLIGQYPSLQRPIGMKLLAKLKTKGKKVTAEELLTMSMRVSQLQQALAPAILNLGADELVGAMRTAKNQQVRRQAAGYLAAIANRGDEGVPAAVVKAYKFDPKAKNVPWKGGPLFIPGLRWKKKDAQALVSGLLAWYVWTEENLEGNTRRSVQQPIINNLNSIQLGAAAGYGRRFGRGIDSWLTIWGGIVGKAEIEKMLKAQKLHEKERYKSILGKL